MSAKWGFLAFILTGCLPADLPPGGSPAEHELQESPLKIQLTAAPLAATFTNTGTEPLRILKPLDGSEWCLIMPHYRLTITDSQGKEVQLRPRCGLYGHPYTGTKWPDDYLVTLPPGESYTHPLHLHCHKLPAAGVYNLRFEYLFAPKTDTTPGGAYPPGLWRGEAVSNTIQTKLLPPG